MSNIEPANLIGELTGPRIVAALEHLGVTHVVWIPDTALGAWDSALSADAAPCLVRVCREGEAIAVAAGLHLGGQRPMIVLQCTGLFEAGDALRNFVHDLHLPLFFLVGVRGQRAHREGHGNDTCPVFTEPIVRAWQVPYVWLDPRSATEELIAAYQAARREPRAGIALYPE